MTMSVPVDKHGRYSHKAFKIIHIRSEYDDDKMKQHSPRQYLFFYLVFVLATAIISTTAMDGGIDVEERYPGVEEEDSLTSEKAFEKEEKDYQKELLKKISEESFLVKLLDDRTDVNVKQNMMRDVNAVDEKTIRSVLKDFECPNEPTIIKGRIGTPDCDRSKVCSIAKASLRM